MTITRQQVDAWDAEVNAAYERGRQEGMKQERALWTLTKVGQEIEAQRPWVGLTDEEHNAIYKQCQGVRVGSAILLTEAKLKEKNT
jgi:uncharacterized protein YecT (DUF1311 family)